MRSLHILSLLNLLAINSKWVFGQQQVQYLNPNLLYGGEFIPDISNIQPYYSGNVFVPYPYLSQIEDPPIIIDQNAEDEVICEEDIVFVAHVPQEIYDAVRAASEYVSPDLNINHPPVTEVVETTTDYVNLFGSGTTTDAHNHSQNSGEHVITTTTPTIEITEMNSGNTETNSTLDGKDSQETVSSDMNIIHLPVTEVVETTTDYVNLLGSGTTTDADDHSKNSVEQPITTTTPTIEIPEMKSEDGKETVASDENMTTAVPVIDGSQLTEITTTVQYNSYPTESHIEDDGYDSSDEQVVISNTVVTEENSNYEAIKPTLDENDIENDLDESVLSDTKTNHPVTVVDDFGVAGTTTATFISETGTNDNAVEAKEHVTKPNMVIQKKNIKYDMIKPTTDENDIESDLNKTIFSQVRTEDTRSGIVTDDAAREISLTEASGLNAPSVDKEDAISKPNNPFSWF